MIRARTRRSSVAGGAGSTGGGGAALWGAVSYSTCRVSMVMPRGCLGAALGAGEPAHAKTVARRVTVYSAAAATVLAAVFALGSGVLPAAFTADHAVRDQIGIPWWFMVAQLPIAGIVFALDGVLLGALCGLLALFFGWLGLRQRAGVARAVAVAT